MCKFEALSRYSKVNLDALPILLLYHKETTLDNEKMLEEIGVIRTEISREPKYWSDIWRIETMKLMVNADTDFRRELGGLLADYDNTGYEVVKMFEMKQEDIADVLQKKGEDENGEALEEIIAQLSMLNPYLVIVGRKRKA